MKALLTLLTFILSFSSPPASAAEGIKSTLTFADKTQMSGRILNIDSDQNTLNLKSPSLQGIAKLKTAQLLDISLDGTPRNLESDHYALASIKGHHNDSHRDTLRGRLVHLDDHSITLDTWYAGQLTLKRSLVHTLNIFTHSPTFYTGPNGPEGWVTPRGTLEENWTFKNRSMISKTRHSIAREIEIPERAKITVTAHWKNSPYFRILFLSHDSGDEYPTSGYTLSVQQNRLTLLRNTPNRRNNSIFSEAIDDLREIEKATFTIYLDRAMEGTSAIYLNEKRIATWTDVADPIAKKEWLQFLPNRSKPLKLSHISVSQWDGLLPTSLDNEPEQEAAPEDSIGALKGQEIRLANGDTVIGSIKKIEQNIATLGTDFGEVRVPLRLMRNIMLDELEDEDRMEVNDVRAWFHEGGYVTIKLKSFDGKTIKGYSQVYGDADFKISAFSRIQFNIWDRNLDPARLSGESDEW